MQINVQQTNNEGDRDSAAINPWFGLGGMILS